MSSKSLVDPFKRGIWITKDEKMLRIVEMETSHIQNCIEKIKHHPKLWRLRYLPLLEEELKRRRGNG